MGWELRHGGRWYLYRNRRVNGKPVKEYIAARDEYGFAEVKALELDKLQRLQAQLRNIARTNRTAFRARIDAVLATTAAMAFTLRTVAEGMLCADGYHQHNRGEWRKRRGNRNEGQ